MLWASGGGGGGYPGVVSDGNGGIFIGDVRSGRYVQIGGNGTLAANLLICVAITASTYVSADSGFSTDGGIGLFSHAVASAPTTGGAHTAGGTYTAVEQGMLEACYTALQSIGLVT